MQNKTQLSLKIVPPSPTSQSGALLLCLGSGSDWRSRLRSIPSSAVLGEDWGPLPLCKSPPVAAERRKASYGVGKSILWVGPKCFLGWSVAPAQRCPLRPLHGIGSDASPAQPLVLKQTSQNIKETGKPPAELGYDLPKRCAGAGGGGRCGAVWGNPLGGKWAFLGVDLATPPANRRGFGAGSQADSHRMGANRRAVFWQWLHLGTAIKQNSHLL